VENLTTKKNHMKSMTFGFSMLLASGLSVLFCTDLKAQSGENNRQQTSASSKPMNDAQFIAKSIRDNRMEIEMAQMALDKSQNENVKMIAEMLVKDHSKMLRDLTALDKSGANEGNYDARTGSDTSASLGADTSTGVTDADTATAGSDNSAVGADGRSPAGDTGTASNQLDIAGTKTTKDLDSASNDSAGVNANANASNDTRNMLANASGNEFDQVWIDQMLTKHKIKLGELQSAKNSVQDARLKQIINTAIPSVRSHRDMLSELKNDPNKPLKMNMKSGKKKTES
jgi:predicted outer membrane protein